MKIEDFRKLKLFMCRTGAGSSDAEVLMAVRKANEIVERSSTSWDKILDKVIKVEVAVEDFREVAPVATKNHKADAAARRQALARKIDEAFATIEESDPRGDFADFVADVKSQWERNGCLSEAQIEAILKSARRAEERR